MPYIIRCKHCGWVKDVHGKVLPNTTGKTRMWDVAQPGRKFSLEKCPGYVGKRILQK